MSDKEKLESIKNGQDVELDGVTVLQSTSFAKEQAEEKKEEVAPSGETKETNNQVEESTDSKQETNNEVNLEPDVKITPDVPSVEVPTEPAVDSQSEVDSAPAPDTTPFTINLDGLNLNNEVEAPSAVTNEPAPEVPTFEQPSQSNDALKTSGFMNSDASSEEFDALLSRYISDSNGYENNQRNTLLPQNREESDKLVDTIFETLPLKKAVEEIKKRLGIEVDIREKTLAHLLKVRNEPLHRDVQQTNDKIIDVLSAKGPLEDIFGEKQEKFSNMGTPSSYQTSNDFNYPSDVQESTYIPGQNAIKGNFIYGEANPENNNFEM